MKYCYWGLLLLLVSCCGLSCAHVQKGPSNSEPAIQSEQDNNHSVETGKASDSENLPDFDRLWDYGNPAATEAKFQDIFEATKKQATKEYQLELLTQIARCQGLQQKFDDAHTTLDEVEPNLTDSMPTARIRYYLERGRAYNSAGNAEKAQELFQTAYDIGVKDSLDFFTVDAAHMLGIVTKGEDSLKWNEEAMKLAEGSDDPRAKLWLGSLYNNIGWTYFDMADYQVAYDIFGKCKLWYEEKKLAPQARIARWSEAKALRMLGKLQESLKIQMELKDEIDFSGEEPDGYVYEEIAECLLLLKKPEVAKEYFAKAYEYLSKDNWLVTNQPDRLERMKKNAGLD